MIIDAKVAMQPTILDRLAQRLPLKTDTEEFRLASKVRKAFSNIKHKQKSNKRCSNPRGGLTSMGARGVYVKDLDIYARRVIVKARYIQNKDDSYREKIRAHLNYISRNEAGIEGKKPELFSEDDCSQKINDIVKKLEDSPHNFRFIISPEDGDKINLNSFTKNLIKAMEKDLKTKLEWVASCHYDTNEPHVHIVINGFDDSGKRLLMSRDYISRGIKNRAAEKITRKLGLREIKEIVNNLDIDVIKSKKCYLDKIIESNIKNGYIDLSKIKIDDLEKEGKNLIIKRLNFLQNCDLAFSKESNIWKIKEDYIKDLNHINRTNLILEKVSTGLKVDKNNCSIISSKNLSEKSIVGYVVSRRYIDEIDDAQYLVIKTDDQKYFYVGLEKYSEKSVVNIGDRVKVDVTRPFDGPKSSDRNIQEIAQAHDGIYKASFHQSHALAKKKLPPGVSVDDFVQVHLKRLEVIARMRIVEKIDDKTFKVPSDFLDKIVIKAQESSTKHRPHIKVTLVAGPALKNELLIGSRLKP